MTPLAAFTGGFWCGSAGVSIVWLFVVKRMMWRHRIEREDTARENAAANEQIRREKAYDARRLSRL